MRTAGSLSASATLGFGLAPFFEMAAKLAWVADRDWYRETTDQYKLKLKGTLYDRLFVSLRSERRLLNFRLKASSCNRIPEDSTAGKVSRSYITCDPLRTSTRLITETGSRRCSPSETTSVGASAFVSSAYVSTIDQPRSACSGRP